MDFRIRVWVRHCVPELTWAHVTSFVIWSSHVQFWKLSIDLNLACTYNNYWQPTDSPAQRSLFWTGKCVILYQLICRSRTTCLSSEPARWSWDHCQRMSHFDSCQCNHAHRMAFITGTLVSSCARSSVTFDIGLHEMCVWVGVRYVTTKFSWMVSLLNFVTHGAPLLLLMIK